MAPRKSKTSTKTAQEEDESSVVDSKKDVKNGKFSKVKSEQDQWVMITQDSALEQDQNVENTPTFVKLRHPKTEQASLFLLTHGDQTVYEVKKFEEKFNSWLIDGTVQEDGGVILSTEIDPVFMVLPYLIKSGKTGKFMTLDQIVTDEDLPECRRLVTCTGLTDLSYVTDVKGDDDIRAYKYNREKTLGWLKRKVEKVVDRLQQRGVYIGSAGQSATYVRSLKEESSSSDDYARFAYGMLCDCIPLELSASLAEHMDIPVKSDPSPVKEPPNKKAKIEPSDLNPTDDYSKGMKKADSKPKGGTMTFGQKQLLKVDKTGMKSIFSFFSPKT